MFHRFVSATVLLVACCLITGCDGRPKRVPVAGTVYIDGQPLKSGQIRVVPTSARSAQSMIDSEGRFTLFTFEAGDGAVLGEHPVEIRSIETVAGGMKWLVPKKYGDYRTSEITIKVEQPTNDMRIDLTWDGDTPVIDTADNTGDAPPVVAPPVEPAPPAEAP